MTYYQQQTHFPVPIQLTHHILYCEARQGSDLQSFYAQLSVITFQLYSNLLTLPLTFSKPLSSESNNTAHFFFKFQIFESERTSNEDRYDHILPPVMLRVETSDMHWESIEYTRSSTGRGVQTQALPL